MRFLLWLAVGGSGWVACAAETRPAAPAATTSPASTQAADATDDEAPAVPATGPSAWLIVDGGGTQGSVFRGWPVRISYRLAGTLDHQLPLPAIKGPSAVSPRPVHGKAGVWYITPEQSKALLPGTYGVTVADTTSEFVLADEPRELSAAQKFDQRVASAAFAISQGDGAGAEKTARDAVASAPDSVEAHALLADALVALGRSEDALDEYNEALQHVPHRLKPPRWLFLKAAQLRAKMVANLPTQESGPPTADEAAYQKLVADGDKSAAALKYPDALRNYIRAQNLLRAKKTAMDPGELEERIAYVREQQKHPATRPKPAVPGPVAPR